MTDTDTRKLSRSAQEAIRMKVVRAVILEGMSQVEVSRVFGVSRVAVYHWVKAYRDGGAKALRTKRQGRPVGGKLTNEQASGIKKSILGRCPDQLRLPGLLWTRTLVAELIDWSSPDFVEGFRLELSGGESMHPFVSQRRHVVESRMSPMGIVPAFDEIKHGQSGLLP